MQRSTAVMGARAPAAAAAGASSRRAQQPAGAVARACHAMTMEEGTIRGVKRACSSAEAFSNGRQAQSLNLACPFPRRASVDRPSGPSGPPSPQRAQRTPSGPPVGSSQQPATGEPQRSVPQRPQGGPYHPAAIMRGLVRLEPFSIAHTRAGLVTDCGQDMATMAAPSP